MAALEDSRNSCSRNPVNGTDQQPEKAKKHPCEGCDYYGGKQQTVRSCNYFLMTGKRRPSEAGEGCTVRMESAMNKKKPLRIR